MRLGTIIPLTNYEGKCWVISISPSYSKENTICQNQIRMTSGLTPGRHILHHLVPLVPIISSWFRNLFSKVHENWYHRSRSLFKIASIKVINSSVILLWIWELLNNINHLQKQCPLWQWGMKRVCSWSGINLAPLREKKNPVSQATFTCGGAAVSIRSPTSPVHSPVL